MKCKSCDTSRSAAGGSERTANDERDGGFDLASECRNRMPNTERTAGVCVVLRSDGQCFCHQSRNGMPTLHQWDGFRAISRPPLMLKMADRKRSLLVAYLVSMRFSAYAGNRV